MGAKDGLLTHQERLVVAADDDLRTQLIREAHAQVSTAHPGRTKTRKIIGDRYYWPGMVADIDHYVVDGQQSHETKHQAYLNHYPSQKDPGSTYPWTSTNYQRTATDMTLP
jgi:hypothetical protein